MRLELTRPDDLLHLHVEGRNLRLDTSDPDYPALVVDDRTRPAFLIVGFPPQSIAETAYFEASVVTPEVQSDLPKDKPDRVPNPVVIDPVDKPGKVKARMAHASRLAFRVPNEARLPFTVEGLLDWSGLPPSLSPIAAIPPKPDPAQIAAAPSIAPPAATETALELPYKLVISPNAAATWKHRNGPFSSRGRTELWHTRLQLPSGSETVDPSPEEPAPLRAIWSEDYNPIQRPGPTVVDGDLGRAAMSPDDRHQIVVLTSAFHGYERDLSLVDIGGGLVALEAVERGFGFTVPYVPKPFSASQLMLSSLGGWLRSRGAWDPPHLATPHFPFEALDLDVVGRRLDPRARQRPQPLLSPAIAPLGIEVLHQRPDPEKNVLDLSEWVHVATQGRDHYVKIVYEGELLPFRNRAALVKITERKFRQQGSTVVAHLFQHMYIIVRKPETSFGKRDMPFPHVVLKTTVTPDIAPPEYIEYKEPGDPKPIGTRSFWVRVVTTDGVKRLLFHAVGTDRAGAQIDLVIPMMFVSKGDVGDARGAAVREYNKSGSPELLAGREAQVPGQPLFFAKPGGKDNTRLVTRTLNFVMDAAGDAPHLLRAEVDVPQVQELLGSKAPTAIRYYPPYVQSDLDPQTGVFAEVVRPDFAKLAADDFDAGMMATTLGVNFSSDQAGGFATPNLGVSTLSQQLGPLAGKAADAVTDKFDPKSFFAKGAAMLFGTFDLADLLLAGTLGVDAPTMRTRTVTDPDGSKRLIAELKWDPKVDDKDLGIAELIKDHGGTSTFHVEGTIEKRLKPGDAAPGDETRFFQGTLTHFRVGVLKAVFVNFVEFHFESRNGQKPDVRVALDTAKPLEFAGDLKFVEELRKAFPPGLFGSGPSLDIAPTGIRAGFAFALPPITVGVFSLKDVSLGAAVTLPFLDGKPAFDFNVSERAHPFLLSVAIFGGTGFFHLQLDTAGLRMVEAALEFGIVCEIDLGVASGGVHILAGIYFKLERKDPGSVLAPTLSGYLRMGGQLSVLGLIKVSLEFMLSFTYDGNKDKAYGRATLTVKVEIVFFSVSVEITVEKAFGGKSGDPKFGEVFDTAAVWNEYALAFA